MMRLSTLCTLLAISIAAACAEACQPEDRPSARSVTPRKARAFAAAGLGGNRVMCAWVGEDDSQIMAAYFASGYDDWFSAKPVVMDAKGVSGLTLLDHEPSGELWLFTVEEAPKHGVYLRRSANDGATWSPPELIHQNDGRQVLGTATVTAKGTVVFGMAERTADGRESIQVRALGQCETWARAGTSPTAGDNLSGPIVAATPKDGPAVFFIRGNARRHLRCMLLSNGDYSVPELTNLPCAGHGPFRQAAMTALSDGRIVAVSCSNVLRPEELSVLCSHDGGRTWPERRTLIDTNSEAPPNLVQTEDGTLHVLHGLKGGGIGHVSFGESWALEPTRLGSRPPLANVAPPLSSAEHDSTPADQRGKTALPVVDEPFGEHVRVAAGEADWEALDAVALPENLPGVAGKTTTPVVSQGGRDWLGTDDGLYFRETGTGGSFGRHPSYGANGPVANVIAGMAADSRDVLWVATPAGLSARDAEGGWRLIRGREGLPWEELTALAIDKADRLWLGSTRGLIQYRPHAEGRQWYYRAGERYLPNDEVREVRISEDGRSVYAMTAAGPGRIDEVPLTLYAKAEYLEDRLNERHRRLGVPAPADYDDAYTMERWQHNPQASDGLWTSYHVTAMSLAYSATGEERYRESAKVGMEALYLHQNATGIPGLVARCVLSVDGDAADRVADQPNWHRTADGLYLWRDDVSSDQLDGHYMAFHAYFEHIAQFDPAERERIEAQVRKVTDYILDHNYQIVDWDGKRTKWGWWNPELLNDEPIHHLEGNIYSLMMLSFLRTAHYLTGDAKYMTEFRKLADEHRYLSNILLQKKLYPDELNHSDDQLSAVAFYPFLQLEHDPYVRSVLHRAVRRHAFIEKPERSSLFAFVYATIDPADADMAGGVRTLREMPRDRRNWRMENAHRADVVIQPRSVGTAKPLVLEVLPTDERHFERWNQDPYEAQGGVDGRSEGDGVHYLLPYWMGRYHGLIAPPGE